MPELKYNWILVVWASSGQIQQVGFKYPYNTAQKQLIDEISLCAVEHNLYYIKSDKYYLL